MVQGVKPSKRQLYADAISLRYDYGLTIKKIAERLNVGYQTVRKFVSQDPRYEKAPHDTHRVHAGRDKLGSHTVGIASYAIRLDGQGDNNCPRCLGGILIRDRYDICCLNCGWRETGFVFNLIRQILSRCRGQKGLPMLANLIQLRRKYAKKRMFRLVD